jgi:hypothetical protein
VVEAFRVLARERPAQGVVAEVGDHEQASRGGGEAFSHVGDELEERVPGEELDAGAGEDLLAGRMPPRTPSVSRAKSQRRWPAQFRGA